MTEHADHAAHADDRGALDLTGVPVLVVGAGIMGAGIAQVAAQAGHRVALVDARAGAAAQARDKLAATLAGLADKGRISADAAREAVARIVALDAVEAADEWLHAPQSLAIEVIVEKLEPKRALLQQLQQRAGPGCVLATNTSSISVTALANGLAAPERLVGMHFFNPVPLMKLVEVVSGLHTDPRLAAAIERLARAWGKVPVHARSTPGFIVNRIARPYYAETLALLQERAAGPEAIDACLRAAGFRMGPCELMDLIGHDTNFQVTQSVYEANFYDKRYQPSLVQRDLVDAGFLGRKSGRGFYRYDAKGAIARTEPGDAGKARAATDGALPQSGVTLHGQGAVVDALARAAGAALATQGWGPAREAQGPRLDPSAVGFAIDDGWLLLTDGRTADERALALGVGEVALFDLPLPRARPDDSLGERPALAWTCSAAASPAFRARVAGWLGALGFAPQAVADAPGLVVARTLAMLINEAADAVQQGVCTTEGADAAMKLGVNYPAGPFEWLAAWGAAPVVALLDALDAHQRGERYRVSPWLRRQVAAERLQAMGPGARA